MQNSTKIKRFFTHGLACLCACVFLGSVYAQSEERCGDGFNNDEKLTTVSALTEALNSSGCKRAPNNNERVLYTAGHRNKLQRLWDANYATFKMFNEPQQFAFAGMHAQARLWSISQDPKILKEYVELLRSIFGTATVEELYQYSSNPSVLIAIQNHWLRLKNPDKVVKLLVPFRRGVIDKQRLIQMTKEARIGLEALANIQVNPGFEKDFYKKNEDLIELAQRKIEEAKKANNQRDRIVWDGKLLGYQRAQKDKSKPSNISYGPAVYLSPIPESIISHFYSEQHGAWSCTLSEGVEITDLSSKTAQDKLLAQEAFIAESRDPKLKNLVKITYPMSGYNQLSNPAAFREVMDGRLIKFTDTVYADNGQINYRRDCEPMKLSSFTECSSIFSLLDQSFFYGDKNKEGYFYSTLSPDQGMLDNYLSTVEQCLGRANKTKKALACKQLKNSDFMESIFYSSNVDRIEDIINTYCN